MSSLDVASEVPRPPEDRQDDLARVRDALRRLESERRALMAMFYVEGMSVHEVATALGVPPGTVKSRLFHAREHLQAALEVSDAT